LFFGSGQVEMSHVRIRQVTKVEYFSMLLEIETLYQSRPKQIKFRAGNLGCFDNDTSAVRSANNLAVLDDPMQLMLGRGRFRKRAWGEFGDQFTEKLTLFTLQDIQ
jgi:hypothetical protein